jgi:probable HAF family extracellular repeat protein
MGSGGSANAINDRGLVAGDAVLPHFAGSHAVVWDGAKLTELGTLGGIFSSANAINNRGQVAGFSDLPNPSDPGSAGYSHAVLWNGKAATDLGTLGGNSSSASAINERGQVVGSSTLNPNDDYLSHATIWNGTHATDLGTLGGASSFASSINNAGLVVGASDIASNTYTETHATLWADGTVIDLNNLLDPKTVSEGWVLTAATDINDKGWIVGNASNPLIGVPTHAFLLTPLHQGSTAMATPMMLTAVPEPQTYAMFLAGLGLMAGTLLARRKVA